MNFEVNAIRFFTSLTLLCSATAASADSLWNHNGSIMHLVENGTKREIYYAEPRQGMMEAGVKPGTLFFDGERIGDDYFGTARVFSSKCQTPMTFSISGRIIDEKTLVLEGKRPKFSNCKATGEMKYESLEFNFIQVIKDVEEEIAETELVSESVENVKEIDTTGSLQKIVLSQDEKGKLKFAGMCSAVADEGNKILTAKRKSTSFIGILNAASDDIRTLRSLPGAMEEFNGFYEATIAGMAGMSHDTKTAVIMGFLIECEDKYNVN